MEFAGIGHNRAPGQKHPKDCHCYTCDKHISHLGIMSHRAMHRRRDEDCEIEFSTGRVVTYRFSETNR